MRIHPRAGRRSGNSFTTVPNKLTFSAMPSLKILNSANRNIVPVDKISYRISKILGAPRDYAYQWCTDFRDDDPKLIDASYTRHVVEKTKKRAIWIQHYSRDGVAKEGVRIVTFSPPDSWHL